MKENLNFLTKEELQKNYIQLLKSMLDVLLTSQEYVVRKYRKLVRKYILRFCHRFYIPLNLMGNPELRQNRDSFK